MSVLNRMTSDDLAVLERLLIRKGIITEEELCNEAEERDKEMFRQAWEV